jgi:Ran GTPase-activating protein (RanGAP) involved in mRNA processing and transport
MNLNVPYDDDHFKSTPSLASVKSVVFENSNLGEQRIRSLMSVVSSKCEQVHLLSLDQSCIDRQGGAEVIRSIFDMGNKGPRIVSLELNNIGDLSLRVLPGMVKKHGHWFVEELNLRSNSIRQGGMRSLAFALIRLSKSNQGCSLERLYLGGNPIGDEGLASLCFGIRTGVASNLTV